MSRTLSARLSRLEVSASALEPLQITIAFVQPGGRVTSRLLLKDGARTELPADGDEYCESARAASTPRVSS